MVIPTRTKVSKRPTDKGNKSLEESDEVLDLFRKNFESQFGSVDNVPVRNIKTQEQSSEDGLSENSDSGESFKAFSDRETSYGNSKKARSISIASTQMFDSDSDSQSDGPQIVKFSAKKSNSVAEDDIMSRLTEKRQRKLFMSAKAPKTVEQTELLTRAQAATATAESQEDLKNDLELNRLIKESRILAEAENQVSHYSGAEISLDAEYNPKAKLKILEMRLDEIGSKRKRSETIPMNIRKGIVAKKHERQAKYDEYAKEAGIVQARPIKSGKNSQRRVRGLQIQTVGKSTKHGHIVSSKEIAERTTKRVDKRKRGRF
jgi:hypothetical protein